MIKEKHRSIINLRKFTIDFLKAIPGLFIGTFISSGLISFVLGLFDRYFEDNKAVAEIFILPTVLLVIIGFGIISHKIINTILKKRIEIKRKD